MSDSTHTAATAASIEVSYGYFYGEPSEPRTFVNLSWANPLYACDDFIATSYPGHLGREVAIERAVAEFNAPKCSCSVEEDGDGENGPHLSIDRDVLCPQHGRKADPAYWTEQDAVSIACDDYLLNAFFASNGVW